MRSFLVVFLIMLCATLQVARAEDGVYNGTSDLPENKGWMGWLSDQVRVRDISIPGTHDSGSRYGTTYYSLNQSLTITQQLNAGVRYLDIRLRHIGDAFAIHHGAVYQKAMFGSVLSEVTDFLLKNPREFVFVRVKEEYEPSNNTRSFERTFDSYRQRYSKYIWAPTEENPMLGQVRGRIVFLQDFDSGELPAVGLYYNTFDIQDQWQIGYDFGRESTKKQNIVKSKIMAAQGAKTNVINTLPISAPPQTPYGSAHQINPGIYAYLIGNVSNKPVGQRYVGIMPMDYPGPGIIKALVLANDLRCGNAFFDVDKGQLVTCLGAGLASLSADTMNVTCNGDFSISGDRVTCYAPKTNTITPLVVDLGSNCATLIAYAPGYLQCGNEFRATHIAPVISCTGVFIKATCVDPSTLKPKKMQLSCGSTVLDLPVSIGRIGCSLPIASNPVVSPSVTTRAAISGSTVGTVIMMSGGSRSAQLLQPMNSGN